VTGPEGNWIHVTSGAGIIMLDPAGVSVYEVTLVAGNWFAYTYRDNDIGRIEAGDRVWVFDTETLSNGNKRNNLGTVVLYWPQ
jgi:hypothetical protein